jgi:hypothetical protein
MTTPLPAVVSGEGVDRAGREGVAKLGDGIAAPGEAGEGAIDPSGFPPHAPPAVAVGRRVRTELALKDRLFKLGDGFATPVLAAPIS